MIFQENNLFAHLDVAANVGSASRRHCGSRLLQRKDRGSSAVPGWSAGRRLPHVGWRAPAVALPARWCGIGRPAVDEPFASLASAAAEMLDLLVRFR